MHLPFDVAGATILVVDDNPTNLGVLVDYFKEFGMRILTARDGEVALTRAQATLPDLILLDVMMPGINGFEVCERLKTYPATHDIPVIFMTALSSLDDKVRGFEAGAVDYVTKPVQQAEVMARVSTHLRLRALTRQLQQANQELQELNATRDKFFSIIAHDLRAPFDALMNFPEIMLMRFDTMSQERMREMLERMHQTARSTYQLLQNLLTWARMQKGHLPYEPQPVRLKDTAAQVFRVLGENARQKNLTLVNTIAQEILVQADPSMAETVLRNLVSNALKFTPSGGQITLAAQAAPQPNFIEVSVTDTGVGIAAEDIEKVFRLDAKHSTRGTANERGSGLGLMLCREMVQKHGGEISIRSAVGEGTTVAFTLPKL